LPDNLASLKNSVPEKNNSNWHLVLRSTLIDLGIECRFFLHNNFAFLAFDNEKTILHLVDLDNNFEAIDFLNLQENYHSKGIKLVHLWEDIWLSRSTQVIARIKSLLGLNIRIHGRKTKVHKLTKPIAEHFIDENHLQGSVNSRYKLGLFVKEELVGVATFSSLRKMSHTENYRSIELIRFAVKAGFSVSGGLSKLIAYMVNLLKPNDLMTYADRDWSAGEVYIRLGFEQKGILEPQSFQLDEQLKRILIKSETTSAEKVFNTGSLKFILRF